MVGEALGCPKLEDVLHVDGFKANLICINQVCDDGRGIHFTTTGCVVKDKIGEVVFQGAHTSNECCTFGLVKNTCISTKVDDIDLWYHRLGHINLANMETISSKQVLHGIPILKRTSDKVLWCLLDGQINQSVSQETQ